MRLKNIALIKALPESLGRDVGRPRAQIRALLGRKVELFPKANGTELKARIALEDIALYADSGPFVLPLQLVQKQRR